MTKGEDLRVVKSIREIKQAFLRLILKKPMDKIKISDIADEALINRKTFYRHFTVLSDVPKRICSDFAEELSEGLKALDPENIRGGVSLFYHLLNTDDPSLKKLFFDNEYLTYFRGLESQFLNDDFFKNFYRRMAVPELGPGYFSAMTDIYLRWRAEEGKKTDLDTLAGQAADLLLNGLG